MERTMIFCGISLCVVSFFTGMIAPEKAIAPFAPMLVGIPIFFLGVIALNPHRRRAATWVAVIVATFGVLYAVTRFFQQVGNVGPMPNLERWISFGMFSSSIVFCVVGALFLRRFPDRTLAANSNSVSDTLNTKESGR